MINVFVSICLFVKTTSCLTHPHQRFSSMSTSKHPIESVWDYPRPPAIEPVKLRFADSIFVL